MNELLSLLFSQPELVMPTVKTYIEKYKPIVYELANELMKVYEDFSNNKDYPRTVAKVRFNQFNAYKEVGFTEGQAMSLLLTDIRKHAELIDKSSKSTTKSTK